MTSCAWVALTREFDGYVSRRLHELRNERPRVRVDTIAEELDAKEWKPADFLEPSALVALKRLNTLFTETGAEQLETFADLLRHEKPFRGHIAKRFRRATENEKRRTHRQSAEAEPTTSSQHSPSPLLTRTCDGLPLEHGNARVYARHNFIVSANRNQHRFDPPKEIRAREPLIEQHGPECCCSHDRREHRKRHGFTIALPCEAQHCWCENYVPKVMVR